MIFFVLGRVLFTVCLVNLQFMHFGFFEKSSEQWISFCSLLVIERRTKLQKGSFTVVNFRYPVSEWHLQSQYAKYILQKFFISFYFQIL